jgi:bifunctional DNA-binding transcriptional regulator/antitoxin component of YhaV-PrlF toxin-antitoxin module
MAETTYHRDKIYLPREIQEKLRLAEGDRLHIEVMDEGEARLRVVRRADAAKRLLEKLESPPDLGLLKGHLTRKEIYEDIA